MMVGLSLEPAATSAMVVLLYEITKTIRHVNNSEVSHVTTIHINYYLYLERYLK